MRFKAVPLNRIGTFTQSRISCHQLMPRIPVVPTSTSTTRSLPPLPARSEHAIPCAYFPGAVF